MPAGARSSGPAILTPSPAVRPSGHRPGPIDPYGYAAARCRRVAIKLKPPSSLSLARDADLRGCDYGPRPTSRSHGPVVTEPHQSRRSDSDSSRPRGRGWAVQY